MDPHLPLTDGPKHGFGNGDAAADWALGLPAFNRLGRLPAGIHEACFEEVIERFAINRTRRMLCHRMEEFLLQVIDRQDYSHAYLGGDFVTAKPYPQVVEVSLRTREPFGLHAFRAMESFVDLGLESIRRDYSVRLRFWCDGTPGSRASFRDFFRDLLPRSANALAVPVKLKRGLVRVHL